MKRDTLGGGIMGVPATALVAVCCGLPLGWMLGSIALNPSVWQDLRLTSFRADLLGRTLLYNGLAGALATILSLPAAYVLGRGRGIWARLAWVLLPATLLMPSLAYAYGWSQFIRLYREPLAALGLEFVPAGSADVARCIWTLAAWLWPVSALLIGLSLRRLDATIQLQARLDGALVRITARQLLGPILAGGAVVVLLASQEFSVYEPTGISVVATEVRMVFETGAFSSLSNPITGAIGRMGGGLPDQPARAAAAVATALPLLGVTLLGALAAGMALMRGSGGEQLHAGDWARTLDAPRWAFAFTGALVLLTVVLPIASLAAALRVAFDPLRWWEVFGDALSGTLIVAGAATGVALVLALSAGARWTRGLLMLATVCFLVGGQLLAIALIRLYNRPALFAVYDGAWVAVLLYVGRFGFLALAVAGTTWTGPWRDLRAMASLDGANAAQTAMGVLWPLAWPMLAGGALLVGALSLTEVPGTVLLNPQRPQVLTPMLMTWVHMARYDPMIEAALLMVALVLVPALAAMGLLSLGRRARTAAPSSSRR